MNKDELKARVAVLEEQTNRLNYAVTKTSIALACLVSAFEKPSAFIKAAVESSGRSMDGWTVEADLAEAIGHAKQAMDVVSRDPGTG